MENSFQIIDVNINRVSEGIRVIEDICRFQIKNTKLCSDMRLLRHQVRKSLRHLSSGLIRNRDPESDIGLGISKNTNLDNKASFDDLIKSNFKRVQEGLRCVEENLKIVHEYQLSKVYEQYRFQAYQHEKELHLINFGSFQQNLPDTDIYGITGEQFSNGRQTIAVVAEMINAGIKVIQYREKRKSGAEKLKDCIQIRKMTQAADVCFIVNDNLDLAKMVDADGVHIGQDDYPIDAVRKFLGENKIIGLSTHSPEQAIAAEKKGANYIGVGPIFETKTKTDVCAPVGIEYLKFISKNISIPYVAIGGIKISNVKQILENGGNCIAMITEIVSAVSITESINQIRKIIISPRG